MHIVYIWKDLSGNFRAQSQFLHFSKGFARLTNQFVPFDSTFAFVNCIA